MQIMVFILVLGLVGQDQKLPVPEAAEQKKAEAEIRSVFREDFAKKTREGKRALAARLLAEAADAKNSPASRYVVLQLSRDLAIEGLDVATIADSIDQLGKLYDIAKPALTGATFTSNTNAFKVAALNSAQKYARSPEDSSLLGDAYLKVAEDTLKDKLFDDAQSAAQAAEKYGKQAKATAVVERAGQMVKEIPELKKEDDAFGKVINSKADDPAAKLVKGRYSLFVVGDESAGIENLLGCSDEGLKNVAKLEAAKPATAEAMSDLAEAWVALVGKEEVLLQKRRYQERARYWFNEALKNAGGILKAKIEKRLSDLGSSSAAGPKATVDLLSKVDLGRDVISGSWKMTGGSLVGTADSAHAKLQLNYVPPDEYDLTVVAERRDGAEDLEFGLVGGGKQFVVAFDVANSTWSGPAWIDGKTVHENGVGLKGKFFDQKKPRTIVCMVRKDSLTIRADGKDFITWKADWGRVSLQSPAVAVPKKDCLWLVVCNPTTYAISRITVTPIKPK